LVKRPNNLCINLKLQPQIQLKRPESNNLILAYLAEFLFEQVL
jgi:hypothetical protein